MFLWIVVGLIALALLVKYLRRPKPPTPDDFDKPPPPPVWPEGGRPVTTKADVEFEELFAEPEGWWWRHIEQYFWRAWHCLRRAKDAVTEWWQRRTIGFAYVEAWNLPDYLARYALPRVRHLRDYNTGYPCGLNEQHWQAILNDIVYALERKVAWDFGDGSGDIPDAEGEPRYERGLKLFGDYWQQLWD